MIAGALALAGVALAAWPWPAEWRKSRAPARGGARGTDAAVDPAAQEALLAAPALAVENERLRQQVEALGAQVGELTVSLAEARFAYDRLKVRLDQLPPESAAAAGLSAGALGVAEVNRALGLVVLDVGAAGGVRPGMQFGVLRDDAVIARVRAVDVRERICGAKVVALMTDAYPEQGDRAVVWRSTMR